VNALGQPPAFDFKYWPFDLVPRPGEPLVWADRSTLKEQVTRLGRRMGRHEAVSLHLLWADFGAGKTHTLLYFKQEAERGEFGSVLPLYCALPKGCRQFLDIYRAIVRSVPAALLRATYDNACKTAGRGRVDEELNLIWAALPRCFRTIAIGGDEQRAAALGWLHSEPGLSTRMLHSLSIVGRIKSTDEAVLALQGIIRLLNLAGHKRVVLLVDEFQRVEALRKQQQDDINAGLHGFFNACGAGMSLVLSFSFGVEGNVKYFLNNELLSRVDPLRISIPSMTSPEGLTFLTEILEGARRHESTWSVTNDVLPRIVDELHSRFKLTPRRLLKAAGLVFELAAIDIEDGAISSLSGEYVSKMVANGDFDRIDQSEED
jgi:hypothetical protein